jgi:hypothetical protein
MVPKSGCRFSEKIMLNQKDRTGFDFSKPGRFSAIGLIFLGLWLINAAPWFWATRRPI